MSRFTYKQYSNILTGNVEIVSIVYYLHGEKKSVLEVTYLTINHIPVSTCIFECLVKLRSKPIVNLGVFNVSYLL